MTSRYDYVSGLGSLPFSDELWWYFQESAAELGERGQCIESQHLGAADLEPDKRQLASAQRQRVIRSALAELSMFDRVVLAVCYEGRDPPLDFLARFGIAARVVYLATRGLRGEALSASVAHHVGDRGTVAAAHAAYAMVRRRHAREHRERMSERREAVARLVPAVRRSGRAVVERVAKALLEMGYIR